MAYWRHHLLLCQHCLGTGSEFGRRPDSRGRGMAILDVAPGLPVPGLQIGELGACLVLRDCGIAAVVEHRVQEHRLLVGQRGGSWTLRFRTIEVRRCSCAGSFFQALCLLAASVAASVRWLSGPVWLRR